MKTMTNTVRWKRGAKLLLLLAILSNSPSRGANITERCSNDVIATAEDQAGRNAWAAKCGYIDAARRDIANSYGMYWTFVPGIAPKREIVPCIKNMRLFTMCPTGCYTLGQHMLFGSEALTFSEATGFEGATVTSLSFDNGVTQHKEQEIQYFTVGKKSKEEVLSISTLEGHRIEVTPDHALVDGAGNVVHARAVTVGSMLLTAEGKPVLVTSVEKREINASVWNVRPSSPKKEDNVLAAEGLATGSIRFQNEWADTAYRLSLRDSVDITGL